MTLEKKGFHLVGGAVRDLLLNKEVNDRDYVAVGYNEAELLALGFKKVGADFPVFLNEKGEEIALPRQERSTGSAYSDFEVVTDGVTLIDDLKRRDLTINAMALSPDGVLVDPYGGQKDLEDGIIRHTSEAFTEDPVRVLRVARFAARFGFKVAPETKELVKKMAKRGALKALKPERIWKELEKVFNEYNSAIFFKVLYELGVLFEIFPFMKEWASQSHYTRKWHAEGSVLNHVLLALRAVEEDECCTPELKFAVLFHDIAKCQAFQERKAKGLLGFEGHWEERLVLPLMDELQKKYRVPSSYIKMAKMVAIHHHNFRNFDKKSEEELVRIYTNKFFPKTEEELGLLLSAIEADAKGKITSSNKARDLTLSESFMVADRGAVEIDGFEYKSGLDSDSFFDKEILIAFLVFNAIKSIKLTKEELSDLGLNPKKDGLAIKALIEKRRKEVVKKCLF